MTHFIPTTSAKGRGDIFMETDDIHDTLLFSFLSSMLYDETNIPILISEQNEKKEKQRHWSLPKWGCTAAPAMWFNPKVKTARNRWETSSTGRFSCLIGYSLSIVLMTWLLPASMPDTSARRLRSPDLRTMRCSDWWHGKRSGEGRCWEENSDESGCSVPVQVAYSKRVKS